MSIYQPNKASNVVVRSISDSDEQIRKIALNALANLPSEADDGTFILQHAAELIKVHENDITYTIEERALALKALQSSHEAMEYY